MLTIIENCEPDEAQMRLVMRGKLTAPPAFSHFFPGVLSLKRVVYLCFSCMVLFRYMVPFVSIFNFFFFFLFYFRFSHFNFFLELPMFADYYRQLGEADMPFAKQCMTHWRRFLMGPPNKPNEDVYGLLDVRYNINKIILSV